MRVDRAAGQHNSSNRLREGLRLALALNVATRGILQEIVPSLAPRALVKIVRKISPDQAVVVIVEEVGAMVDAVAVDAAEIKRRQMVVPPLQHLRMRLQHLPQDLQARPCRDGQFLWEATVFRWGVLERTARHPSARPV